MDFELEDLRLNELEGDAVDADETFSRNGSGDCGSGLVDIQSVLTNFEVQGGGLRRPIVGLTIQPRECTNLFLAECLH